MAFTIGTFETEMSVPSQNQNFNTAVAALPNGGFVATWMLNLGVGSNQIMARVYNADGIPVSDVIAVTNSQTHNRISGDVAVAPNGDFFITWRTLDSAGGDIFMRGFYSHGAPHGPEFQANQLTTDIQLDPNMTTLADGSIIVTWTDFTRDGSSTGVFGRKFHPYGTPASDDFRINTTTTGAQDIVKVEGLSNGGFVAVWRSSTSNGTSDIFMQRFDGNAAKIGAEVRLTNTSTAYESDPQVASLANGHFVVTYEKSDAAGRQIVAQRFDLAGDKVGAEIIVPGQSASSVVGTADGGFAITVSSNSAILLQRFDASGAPLGGAWPVSERINGEYSPDMALLKNGSFVVTWDAFNSGGGYSARFARFGEGDFLGEGDDRAMGTNGSDFIEGFGGNDELYGGNGNDVLVGAEGGDRLVGGAGFDEANYNTAMAGVSLNMITNGHGGEAAGDRFDSIEQFSLSRFNDRFIGGNAAEVVLGLAGDDLLIGGGGADHLDGGIGDDSLEGGEGADLLNGGDGVDEASFVRDGQGVSINLITGVHGGAAAGDFFANIERFTLTRFDDNFVGSLGADHVAGGLGNDRLEGLDGRDVLDGGQGNDLLIGGLGDDQLIGGGGDDTYILSGADFVYEGFGGGFDTVVTAASYQLMLGTQVEQIVAENPSSPEGLVLVGNEVGQTIRGNAGGNIINGLGGADLMYGLGGDDYYVADGDDQVFEAAGAGFDTIAALGSFQLGTGSAVEMIVTADAGGTAAVNLVGNEFAQTIIGNNGGNVINGLGGADTLSGLGGNDYYIVDSADTVFEALGGGYDIVAAVANHSLAGGSEVELLLTADEGSRAALVLVGNELGQVIRANAGDNVIAGGGGADMLFGLGGGDYYVVDSDDVVIEVAGGGYDIVASATSFALGAGSEVEMMVTSNEAGTAAIMLAGNELAQTIWGNAGANVIDGKGGADTLRGLGGADTFAFTTALGGGNVDTILDFAVGSDKIALDDAVFTGLGLSSLNPNAFRTGSAAQDADDRIIYDQATGALLFDVDGAGGAAAVQFAAVGAGLNLGAGDFVVI